MIILEKLDKWTSRCKCTQCGTLYVCNHYDAKKSRVGDKCDACKDIITNAKHFTQADLLKFFDYDPISGKLTHRLDTRRCKAGHPATHHHSQGYLSVVIGGVSYLAHRVIWFMQTGVWPDQVDHINHDRSDNIWTNLREVDSRQNQMNMGKRVNNSSGVNGIKILSSGRFYASIMVKRQQKSLGTYDTLEEAVSARKDADKLYGFHPNHGS